MPVKSPDDPRCVVHYLGLQMEKDSPIILLCEKSYNKLIDCKKIRIQSRGEDYHVQQCETIPIPSYDPERDGYHRPCYMKFIKTTVINKLKCDQENNNEKSLENHI